MKLMTKELERKFAKAGLYTKDGQGFEAEVVVKYFNPYGAGTWIITEGKKRKKWRLVIIWFLSYFGMGMGLCKII